MFMFFGGAMCPVSHASKMCPLYAFEGGDLICFGVKIFLLVWVVAVPIIMTSRLDKIVKLLQDKK